MSESNDDLSLEDEFAKLLNDFINQDDDNKSKAQAQPQVQPQQNNAGGLDSMMNAAPSDAGGLDSMMSAAPSDAGGLDSMMSATPSDAGGLDSMMSAAPSDAGGLDSMMSAAPSDAGGLDSMVTETPNDSGGLDGMVTSDGISSDNLLDSMVTTAPDEGAPNVLKAEEQELARAISNFSDGIKAMANNKNLKLPKTDYTESMLMPNYKPSVGKKIAQYLLDSWDIINKYAPEDMKRLSPDASDEEYLSFAESLNDTYMQLAIISYVEILINLEICEVSYEQKKEQLIKNRIKRELYEEYMELQERKNMFIEKLKEKNFPIDVDKLINNYFRAAQKDADGAFDALTKNPAMFARIEVEKLRPKFFGLIKVTPEDGIKINQKIGAFIKKLKV